MEWRQKKQTKQTENEQRNIDKELDKTGKDKELDKSRQEQTR
jgi:hypothetical protein